MSRLQGLKVFINQRLTAAVEDILGHFERTITEYEAELDHRHRTLLGVALTPDVKLQGGAGLFVLFICWKHNVTVVCTKLTLANVKASTDSLLAAASSC